MKREDIKNITYDFGRPHRTGFSEVVFCQGKQDDDVILAIEAGAGNGENLLATRLSPHLAPRVLQSFPDGRYDAVSKTFRIMKKERAPLSGRLAILTAGSSDVAIAEEARWTAEFYGVEPQRYYDVGVAGLSRLLARLEELHEMDVAIVLAGMEGALPSVLGGLIPIPIIAVPTSTGYGTHLGGWTPLFAMLTSCSEGVVVTNIDNGYGAACAALRILRRISCARE